MFAHHDRRIGLALGGGAVRGMAHIGVLSVLQREGIPIDFVSGTSAGAIAAALFCAGMDVAEIREMAAHIGWRRLAVRSRSSRGLLNFDRLERLTVMMMGDLTFAELHIPLAIVTMDADTGERVVLRQGRVAPAVHASSCVPGFVEPVPLNGRLLSDGGIVDNLPVSAVRDLGADYVIGVDLFQPAHRPRLGPLGPGLMAIELMVQNAGGGTVAADCLIEPHLSGKTYVRFSDADELIALGEEAAEAHLPKLRAFLANGHGHPVT